MITSRQQNLVQNQNMVIGNLSFGNVETFKCLGVTVTNTNDIRKDIIHLRKLYRPACFQRNEKLFHIKLLHYQLYCMDVKLGLSP